MHGAALRMVTHLNTAAGAALSAEVAAHAIVGEDAAHHVLDPDGVLGLDPLHATALEAALPVLVHREPVGWLLGLPRPGHLGPLRGPVPLNHAALASGTVVLGLTGEIALVPLHVGRAVQWRVYEACSPLPVPGPYEAERVLDQTVRRAARALTALDVPGGPRPPELDVLTLPAGYTPRRRNTADKAARLLWACESALANDGGAMSVFEMNVRSARIREVRDAAADALCAAVSWAEVADEPRSALG